MMAGDRIVMKQLLMLTEFEIVYLILISGLRNNFMTDVGVF